MMQALSARDHLRQQVAWSLSHIFVVSSQEVGENHLNTMWAHVHGNFIRSLLGEFIGCKEVASIPIMGKCLAHVGVPQHFVQEKRMHLSITTKSNVGGDLTLEPAEHRAS